MEAHHQSSVVRRRYLALVERNEGEQHADTPAVDKAEHEKHGQVHGACSDGTADRGEQGTEKDCLFAAKPVGRPGRKESTQDWMDQPCMR